MVNTGNCFMSGNEALAEGLLAAGCDFYSGYPITPSSEIMERIAVHFAHTGQGVFIQMEDEISSICAAIGASWSGARAVTATSGPGFSLMMEAMGYAIITETSIVVVNIQRAGPCTGQATRVGSGDIMQAKWGSHGDYQIIAISPWSVQEMYEMASKAFILSERFRLPVIMLGDEAVGHLRESVRIGGKSPPCKRKYDKGNPPFGTVEPNGVPPMPVFGKGARLLVTGSTHDEWGVRRTEDGDIHQRLVTRLSRKVLDHRDEICKVETFFVDDAEFLIIAYGFTARSALFAAKQLRQEGIRVGMIRLQTIWPFPEKEIIQAAKRAKFVFVPEMNMGQVMGEVLKISKSPVIGFHQVNGEIIHPHNLIEWIKTRLQ